MMCTLTVPDYFMPGMANPLGPIPCSISEALMSTNCILGLFQVPSVNNLADRPSRSLSGRFPSVCQLLEAITRYVWWSKWPFS